MRAINRAAKRGNKGTNQFERRNQFVSKDVRDVFNDVENIKLAEYVQIFVISPNHIGDYGFVGALTKNTFGDVWGNSYDRRHKHLVDYMENVVRHSYNYKCYYEANWGFT